MVYSDLTFPTLSDRPYFFSNFVTTVDGKAQILKDTKYYWPLGSKLDYETLILLRTRADALIHGKVTTLSLPDLSGIKGPYIVIANHPDQVLLEKLKNHPQDAQVIIATSKTAALPEDLSDITVARTGEESVDIKELSQLLFKRGFKKILIEGGPTLMGGFFKEDLIDEIFLTLAPKIVGGEKGLTLSMVEGELLPPDQIKKLKLISVNEVDSELYLRYSVRHQ